MASLLPLRRISFEIRFVNDRYQCPFVTGKGVFWRPSGWSAPADWSANAAARWSQGRQRETDQKAIKQAYGELRLGKAGLSE